MKTPLPLALIRVAVAAGSLTVPLLSSLVSDALRERMGSSTPTLFAGVQDFYPGETSVTYADTLVPYLTSSDSITITDPYLRQHYQIRQLQELLIEILDADAAVQEIQIRTTLLHPREATPRWGQEDQLHAFLELVEQMKEAGVSLNFTFPEDIHDRSITTSEWRILLGRGLNFWEKPTTIFDPGKVAQHHRRVAKHFTISYHRQPENVT